MKPTRTVILSLLPSLLLSVMGSFVSSVTAQPLGALSAIEITAPDTIETFPVGGDYPQNLAFDGANIWVVNYFSETVTKLRASDGALLGTFPSGAESWDITFDGANVWISNNGSVSKRRASDGALLGTFSVGHFPQ